MEFIKIVLFCILASISYGVVHDQFTARICVEYFTVAHPPVFHTESPTLLGLGWGVIATWWVGLFLGVPLAMAARIGERRKLGVRQLVHPVAILLAVMACAALLSGSIGYTLAARATDGLSPFFSEGIPPEHRLGFVADFCAHLASYAVGFFGGLVVIARTWWKRHFCFARE